MKVNPLITFFRSSFILLQLFLFSSSFAQVGQNGWELIRQNDFVQAKAAFLSQLEADPKDKNALIGLMFIAETVQDYQLYKTHSKALIESDWNETNFALFGHLYEADPAVLLKKLDNETFKSRYRFSYADTLFQQRKFAASRQELRKVIGDYDWSIIGPFSNLAGSGFKKILPIEEEPFNASARYKNDRDVELSWVDRHLRPPSGVVAFNKNLPFSYDGTYYANTFITTPEDRITQFRIARTTPMKIWLDDQLIFEQANNIAYEWDLEVVEVPLKAGTHRILVKCASYFDQNNSSTISLQYNDGYDQGDGYMDNDYDYQEEVYRSNYSGSSLGEFCLRITDEQGKVFQDIASSFSGVYQPGNVEYSLIDDKWIAALKTQIAKGKEEESLYYLLAKAFFVYNYTEAGEAFFYPIFQANKDDIFYRYLMAKFYAANGKGEKAEALLTGLDETKTPFFALMQSELSKIDPDKNEDSYLSTLDKLLQISPTNWGIISAYLDYYASKGKGEEKKAFVKSFLEAHPKDKYKKRLSSYLEEESYKPSSYKAMSDKEKDKKAKEALKRKKKVFEIRDYWILINHYKRKDKHDQLLALYDELTELFPYKNTWQLQKAKYLFEIDRLDEALKTLSVASKLSEYDYEIPELRGDIQLEAGDKDAAYASYQAALDLLKKRKSAYGSDAIRGKMEKIKEQKSFKTYFQTRSFGDALSDQDWQNKYPGEESVILLYNIEAALDKNNKIDYNQKMLIAIQNEAGAKYWTEANFNFLGNISFVKVIKKDGRELSPNRNYGYVVFKNLEPGDKIQIEGNSEAMMSGELHDEFYHIAAFSHEVPVYRAQFEFLHDANKKFYYTCNRLDCATETRTEDQYKIVKWDFFDIPKMVSETAVLDDMDAFAWIMFSTMEDWSEVAQWYLDKTYRRLETNYQIDSELLGILQEGMTEQELVEAIYNYLTKEITYSFVGFLNSNYIPKKPSATISDQIGDCKDVASLMIAMLRKAGIEAHYVLVRSSNFTDLKPLPTVQAFNHVIVGYVLSDGKMRYLDLTTDYYPHYVIPEFDNNSWALIVREGETDVFRLPNDMLDPQKTRLNIEVEANINTDRSLDMEANTIGKGVFGGKFREELNRVTAEDDRQKYLLNYFGGGTFDHLSLEAFQFENLEDISAPLKMNMKLRSLNYMERVSNFFIVQVPLLKGITTRPALFNEDRYNNLDLNALFELAPSDQTINLRLPAAYAVMELPEDIHINNQFGSYTLQFTATSTGLQINRKLAFKQRLVNLADYKDFKAFYLELLDADRTKIAVKKVMDN